MNKNLKLALVLAALSAVIAVWYTIPLRDGVMRQMWGLNQAHYEEFATKVKARKLPKIDKRFSMRFGDSIPPIPTVTPAGGRHPGPVKVRLQISSTHRQAPAIYFTLDGSVPTRRDRIYREPIAIDSNTVLRFRTLPKDQLPGEIGTQAYFVGDKATLPILSIATDPVNLWNKYSGIYENPLENGRSWERQADVQFLEINRSPLNLSGALRIHGGYSRRVPKKSFRFRFSLPGEHGLNPSHPLISTATQGENTFIIRAGGERQSARIRDALSSRLFSHTGGPTSAFEPAQVFLNGVYWGLYDLRERIDLGYLRYKFGEGEYELLGFDSKNKNRWGTPVIGKKKHWEKTIRFFKKNSLADSGAFSAAASMVDIENTCDYWIHNIYSANIDWPYNNFNAYRKTGGSDTRWKWISWDVDGGFDDQGKGLTHNTLEWGLRDRVRNDLKWNYAPGLYEDQPTYVISTLFMRRFLENQQTRAYFVNRFLDLLNTSYLPKPALALFDSILALTEKERARDFVRWNWKESEFQQDLGLISQFLQRRPSILREHLRRYFSLGEPTPVKLSIMGPGRVKLNSLTLTDTSWQGVYLAGLKIHAEALPDSGAVFLGWNQSGPALDPSKKRIYSLNGPLTLSATFGTKIFLKTNKVTRN